MRGRGWNYSPCAGVTRKYGQDRGMRVDFANWVRFALWRVRLTFRDTSRLSGAIRCIWVRFAHPRANGAKRCILGSTDSRTVRRRIRLSKSTSGTREKIARLLLHPNRARFGQQSRTTLSKSPEKRIKKFRILVTPFARSVIPD